MATCALARWPRFLTTSAGRSLGRPLTVAPTTSCHPSHCRCHRITVRALLIHTTTHRGPQASQITHTSKPLETVDQQRKRLIYQSRKRGILENDLLLSNFLQHQAKSLSPAELSEIDTLLNNVTDWDLYYYLTDKQPVPADIQNLAVWPKLKATVREKRDGVLMMPPLN